MTLQLFESECVRWLEGIEFLHLENVGEILHRNAENICQRAQLVEGGIAASSLIARELRIIDFGAFGPGLDLNASKRKAIARPQTFQIASKSSAPPLLIHWRLLVVHFGVSPWEQETYLAASIPCSSK